MINFNKISPICTAGNDEDDHGRKEEEDNADIGDTSKKE
jgi:hypothetical protein